MAFLRLVLAEADPQDRDDLLMMLADGRPPAAICVENSGAMLLRTLRQCTVDAVIVSDALPDYDVACLIRDISPHLLACPVIVLSHREDQSVAVRCFRGGVSDFIPIEEARTPGALWKVVMRAVLSHRRRITERRCSERRQRLLKKAADTDQMTDLFNRRYFRDCCENRRWAGDRRQFLAVNLIDVDNFKQVNDSRGHAAGDQLIKAVAQQIRQHCHPSDLPFRWGGDEFLVLRYSGDLCESWIWANRLRAKVDQMRLEHTGQKLSATLSIGLALVPTRRFSEDAVEEADRSLYLAKQHGRNRVCTEDMMRLLSVASHITQDAGLDIEQRRRQLLQCESARLGPVQTGDLTQHSQAVGQLCWLLGRACRLPDELSLEIRRVGLLHDMGKFVIPEVLLGKASPLDAEEWQILSQSPQWSAIFADRLNAPRSVVGALRAMARTEPAAEEDSELRTMSNVARVADALASMLAGRVYRPPMTLQDALAELRRNRDKMFDSDVVAAAHFISPPDITHLPLAA